jgi:hypothetical protein
MTAEREINVEFRGRSLDVTIEVERWGSLGNGWDDPGEGPEWGVASARDITGADVALSEDDRAALWELINDKHTDALEPPEYDDWMDF